MKLTEEQKNELGYSVNSLKTGVSLNNEQMIVDAFVELAKRLIRIPEIKKLIIDKIFETFGC